MRRLRNWHCSCTISSSTWTEKYGLFGGLPIGSDGRMSSTIPIGIRWWHIRSGVFVIRPKHLSCDALYQFFWYFSFIPTRVAISASWILRVYAVVDHGLIFGLILTVLGLAIIAFDILQGVQSTCTHNTLSSETL
ncbi:hypothetical protein FB446DRAFT_144077 [Lentinula raphanica]|nr:hypothetical protein FB446DRAFT_144077 [Lentinula raphanica]